MQSFSYRYITVYH